MTIQDIEKQTGAGPPPGPGDDAPPETPGHRRPWPWLAAIAGLVAVALAVALTMVLVDDDDGADVRVDEPTTAAPGSTQATAPDTTASPGGGAPTPTATTAPPAATMQVTVYFLDDDLDLVPVERTVPTTRAVARAAMTELLRGPAGSDPGSSTIPAGTRLLGITVDEGIATVDLSSEFATGGGSASMGGRVAQVVYTLTEFGTVDAVQFLIEGQPVEALGGEGIPLAEPQTRADWADL